MGGGRRRRRPWKCGGVIILFAVVALSVSSIPGRWQSGLVSQSNAIHTSRRLDDCKPLLPGPMQAKAAVEGYLERSGGVKQIAGAIVVGGVGGSILLSSLPLIGSLAPLAGMACGAYCVQLPRGDPVGDCARKASKGIVAFWDAVTGDEKI
mmetsp:Transcript_28949/g.76377  ORF Transcript_28949/g.76377 Transcript_28949/m.76377 type:complete len:151 (-) Transcript_28949:2-454(-)